MNEFENVVTTERELRDIVGLPIPRVVQKDRPFVDAHCREFIERSPFLLMATSDLNGRCDVSPKGDAPGFVLVLDERQLVIPDRPGNKRLDGMTNLIANPHVGLIFLVPGRDETLRINGRACITRDPALLRRFEIQGKTPLLAIVVDVEQCYLHCGKAFLRSRLWAHEQWPAADALPSLACVLFDQLHPEGLTLQEYEGQVEDGYRNHLY
jgi:PPOX class probable FMN-dependent enzyme